MTPVTRYLGILQDNRAGRHSGVFSACTASWYAIQATLMQAERDGAPLACVDFTSAQVNQDGGYTGLTPAEFNRRVLELAAKLNLSRDRVLLGGDHLGPNPWRHLPANEAMARAAELVRQAVLAGTDKIHLDPSMPLGGDPTGQPLHVWGGVVAERTAFLAKVAEDTWKSTGQTGGQKVYSVGTEVPPPGGEADPASSSHVSSPADAEFVLESMRAAFYRYGLQEAYERTVAIVVEPGIAEGAERNRILDAERILGLTGWIRRQNRTMGFEAHSTDGNPRWALTALVMGGFPILKVGPALTVAVRQTLEAMVRLEELTTKAEDRSNFFQVLDSAMLAEPRHWDAYYGADPEKAASLRRYSFLNRDRYYMTLPEVVAAKEKLFANLTSKPIPSYLIATCLPLQARLMNEGIINWTPDEIIIAGIREVTKEYSRACGHSGQSNRE